MEKEKIFVVNIRNNFSNPTILAAFCNARAFHKLENF